MMLYKLDEADIKVFVQSARLLEHNRKIEAEGIMDFVKYGEHTYIDVDKIICWMDELNGEIEHLKEEYEDLENDLESNYKPISAWEMSGMSERDFI